MRLCKKSKDKNKDITNSQYNYRSMRIDQISAPSVLTKGKPLNIFVEGHFPDLGWEFDETKYNISKNEIIISVIGKRKIGIMAAQALKPYQTVIEIKKLKKGSYKIRAEKGIDTILDLIVE